MPRLRKNRNKDNQAMAVDPILIGADPELFAVDTVGDFQSVHDILPGTKAFPLVVPRGAIQVDGVAAEFNINPARSRSEFMKNLKNVESLLLRLLQNQRPQWRLEARPTAHFRPSYFASLPEHALALGCDPDYNAYTGEVQEKPDGSVFYRTGSGHIHIGWTKDQKPLDPDHFKTCCDLVKELDFVLYSQSSRWDKDKTRASLYGKPGSFRPKPYGVEYRVLSNAWLNLTNTRMFVYDAAKATAEQFFKGFRRSTEWKKDELEYEKFLEKVNLPNIENYAL